MRNKYPQKTENAERAAAQILAVIAVLLIIALPFLVGLAEKNNGNLETVSPEETSLNSANDTEYASYETGVITLETGETETSGINAPKIESLGDFTLTAYCPCVKCCGEWSAEHPSRVGTDYIQKTASGTIPKEGRTVSVDPDVIPFGTTIIVDGHEYIAEDRGSAVNQNHIDIYFNNHEDALVFGRQTREVFIKTDTEI